MLRKYYGKNYEKAMRNTTSAIYKAKSNLIKQYPHATLNKFDFEPVLTQQGDVTRVDIFFINDDILSTDITSSTFKNDKNMWKWLHNNKGVAFVEDPNVETRRSSQEYDFQVAPSNLYRKESGTTLGTTMAT